MKSEQRVTHYTVEALAAKWQLSERTVRRRIWAGELKAVRIPPANRAVRVPVEEVERYERSFPAA